MYFNLRNPQIYKFVYFIDDALMVKELVEKLSKNEDEDDSFETPTQLAA